MKNIGTLLIAGLVVLSVIVAFATPVMATDLFEANGPEVEDDPVKFKGTIVLEDGPLVNTPVIIAKWLDDWAGPGWYYYPGGSEATTDSTGFYETGWADFSPDGHFGMFVNQGGSFELLDEKDLTEDMFTERPERENYWVYRWDYMIPEFATMAIPVVSILGLLFLFNHRKHKKE